MARLITDNNACLSGCVFITGNLKMFCEQLSQLLRKETTASPQDWLESESASAANVKRHGTWRYDNHIQVYKAAKYMYTAC